jgi:hypothetical protein
LDQTIFGTRRLLKVCKSLKSSEQQILTAENAEEKEVLCVLRDLCGSKKAMYE